VPYEVRLKNYEAKRAQIFKNRSKRLWEKVKKSRTGVQKLLNQVDHKGYDLRPYASVELLDKKYIGLLDSGASVWEII